MRFPWLGIGWILASANCVVLIAVMFLSEQALLAQFQCIERSGEDWTELEMREDNMMYDTWTGIRTRFAAALMGIVWAGGFFHWRKTALHNEPLVRYVPGVVLILAMMALVCGCMMCDAVIRLFDGSPPCLGADMDMDLAQVLAWLEMMVLLPGNFYLLCCSMLDFSELGLYYETMPLENDVDNVTEIEMNHIVEIDQFHADFERADERYSIEPVGPVAWESYGRGGKPANVNLKVKREVTEL